MKIENLDPDAAEVQQLLSASDAYYVDLYPAESNHLASNADLKRPDVLFIGGRIEGRLVASGAAKIMHDDGDYAEIKRVFVRDRYRGRGLSRAIMQHLETEYVSAGSLCFASKPASNSQRRWACIAGSDIGSDRRSGVIAPIP